VVGGPASVLDLRRLARRRRARRRLAGWARRSLLPIPCAYVLWFRRDRPVKNAIGSFLAAPLFALVALRELRHALIDEHLGRLTASIGLAYPAGSPDLALAGGTDRMGLGRARA
jgi:hypothetical protein